MRESKDKKMNKIGSAYSAVNVNRIKIIIKTFCFSSICLYSKVNLGSDFSQNYGVKKQNSNSKFEDLIGSIK